MRKFSDALPWATIFLCVLVLFYAVVGGIETLKGQIDFETYGKQLAAFGIGLGVLGVGRGIAANKS